MPFPGLLAGFTLVLEADQPPSVAASGVESWVFAGSTLLTLAVLGMGVLLLVRDAAREREISRLRAEFVSGVSHELKTPLTLIRAFAETLSTDPVPVDSDRHAFCGVITREADRLTSLIDRVLSFSRIERGERPYHLTVAPLERVVRDTLDGYGGYLRGRGFVVAEVFVPGLPPVRHDPDAVAEALVNLLDNAAKYSGESREIAVSLACRDSRVVLEVADRGVGIALDEQQRIFDRFYRGGARVDRGGYGLGLFLVKHIADAHGGEIEVDSAPGAGSRFRLVFPAAVPESEGEAWPGS